MDRDRVITQLHGHTIVLKLLFETRPEDGLCTLVVDLADEQTKGSSVVRVQFAGVSDLTIREFGGGITQLLNLKIEDIRQWQWEGVAYRVTESERETITFLCGDVSIVTRYPLGYGGA